jgi:hypothetical protein
MKFIDLFSLGRNLFPVKHDKEKLRAALAERTNLQARTFVEKFDSIVENRMSLWQPGDSFSKVGTRFLLGVCPIWNGYDAYLLDSLSDSLKKKSIKETLDVLNLDCINNLEDLQKNFGDIDTTILGIWEDGVFQKSLWGWDAKNFLTEKFAFVWDPPKSGVAEVLFIK